MTIVQILVLALLQGLTEFLPISSSAHLILVNRALGYSDEGLVFDVAVHLGSLFAVVLYFRRDLIHMLLGRSPRELTVSVAPRLVLMWLVLATVPIVLVGWYFGEWIASNLRGTLVIAWATIGFGLLLGVADWLGQRRRAYRRLAWPGVAAMAFAQALALIPGASRAGVTMTAGLYVGLSRQTAARFSFLMAIPAISAAGVYGIVQIVESRSVVVWLDFLLGVAASALGAWLCIHWFLKLLDAVGLLPFVVYRIVLGVVLLVALP